MSEVKVSVVVPVYNVERYLDDCLNSLLNQTLSDIEIICINDGSTDGSYDILKKYDENNENIKVFSFKNKGLGISRNRGLMLAKGKYVTFVDSDDWVENDFLEKAYNNAVSNDSEIVLCNAIEEYGDHQKERIYFTNEEIESENFVFDYKLYRNRLLNYYLTAWSKLFKTEFLKENNIKFPGIIFEDGPFHVETLLKAKRVTYCNKIFYHYRKDNSTSIMANINKTKAFNIFDNINLIKNILKENNAYDDFRVEFIRYQITQLRDRFFSLNEIFRESFYYEVKKSFLETNAKEELLKIPKHLVEFYNNIINSKYYYEFSNSIAPFHNSKIFEVNDFSLDDNLFIKQHDGIHDLKLYSLLIKNIENDILDNNFSNLKCYEQIIDEGLFDYNSYINENSYSFDMDALLYYIYFGYKEHQNPTSFFDDNHFREVYSIKNELINPYVYYILQGRFEGKNKLNVNINISSINQRDLNRKIKNFNNVGIDNSDENTLIVSLTSFPDRMEDIKFTLYSLLNQSFKPNKLILNLALDEFPNKENDLPIEVLNFKKNGLIINWCENLRSFKKLLPVLRDYPNSVIVTADDDVFYRRDWLKILWEEHKKFPKDIIVHRPRLIKFKSKNVLDDYNNWPLYYGKLDSSYLNFFTGVGGILYPPNSLHEDVFDKNKYMKICPLGDDIWFWGMAVKNGTKIRVPSKNMPYLIYNNALRELNLNNQKTLWKFNQEGSNDSQIKQLIDNYPEILELILGE